MMKTEDRRSVWFCSSILDGLDFMFGEKHWNRGAIKCLDIFMEGMVDC